MSIYVSKFIYLITLLRVIPAMTFQDVYLDLYSIYSDNLSDVYSVYLGKYSGIPI